MPTRPLRILAALPAALALLMLPSCATAPAPPPPPPEIEPAPAPEAPREALTVTAGRLNVREAPSKSAPIVAKVRRGAALEKLGEKGDWFQVRSGETQGWVMKPYVRAGEQCPPDREMEILDEPPAVFGETSRGRVVLEARVDETGVVRSVKVAENTTGDKAFAALAEEDLRKFRFAPPVKRCRPVAFTYVYTRNF